MPPLPIGEYRPDVSDLRAKYTSILSNVLPRGDGYGPLSSISILTAALPSACRGYFVAQQTDGSGTVAIFAGTATDLYTLDNSTFQWTLASRGGVSYTDLSSDAHWRFAQFGNVVIATQKNDNQQSYNLISSTAFADTAGSPPRAGGVTVINRFVVLYDLLDYPARLQWSGLNAITTYTPGVNYSSYQDFPDGGRVMAVAGGEFGIILQAQAVRRITLALGSDLIFQIERIARDRGLLGAYSLVEAGNLIMFATPAGFMSMGGDGMMTPVGLERVDRAFLASYDPSNTHMIIGAADPARNLAIWAYKSLTGVAGQTDKGFIYNWALQRWSTFTLSTEFIAQAAQPGVTLEFLDTITTNALTITNVTNNGSGLFRITVASTATLTTGDFKTITRVNGTPNANASWTITVINATQFDLQASTFAGAYTSGGIVSGSMETLAASFDSYAGAVQPQISVMDTTHSLGFFTGTPLEATLETSEQRQERSRMYVNGGWPLTDATAVSLSAGTRDSLTAAWTYGAESSLTSDGHCPLLADGRGVRFRLRIPAGTTWTYCMGVEGDLGTGGVY